jgi:hypothetical protein|tara:strand:+ start:146 stop:505 length:360 start_codon:yes stop_codon:yes gene_type:complete
VWDKIKKDATNLGILLLVFTIIMKIILKNETLFTIIKVVLTYTWAFILPGFILLYYWKDKFSFLEQIIVGSGIGLSLVGTISYYAGLLGANVNYHFLWLPLLLNLISCYIAFVYVKKDQ